MQTIVVCLSVCAYLCLSQDLLSSCVRLSVRLSVLTIRYCIETTGQIELGFLAWRLFFTYPALCYNEIRETP